MKKYIIVISLLSITFLLGAKNKQPNVLFFLVDDLGWADVGYNGSEFYLTPNIDQLAEEGMQFTNAYATHPRCVPSRYSLVTGKYPARAQMPGPGEGKLTPHGTVERPGDESNFEASEHTIASALKKQGYKTFFTGKWHLASSGTMPEDVGWDINIAGGHAGSPISFFYPYNVGLGKKAPIEGLDDGSKEGDYLTDRITDETLMFLEQHLSQNPDQPFFTYISHYAVHEPLQAKKEHIKIFEERLKTMKYDGPEYIEEGTGTTKMHQNDAIYAAMVYSMDESLGRITDYLKEKGELDNTIIIVFGDNGGLSNRGNKERRVATSNYPLRAGKGHLYEGGIREPMIIKWPGQIAAGSSSDAVVTGNDFFPTILDLVGAPLEPQAHLDGVSLANILRNKNDKLEERAVFFHSPVARPQSTGDSNCTAVIRGNYKLIEFYDENRVELYDLENDLGEQHNLAEAKPEITKQLLKELHAWRKGVNAYMKPQKK